jgi:hypothetical protein
MGFLVKMSLFQIVPYFRISHISDCTIFQIEPYFRLYHISSKTLKFYQRCICAMFYGCTSSFVLSLANAVMKSSLTHLRTFSLVQLNLSVRTKKKRDEEENRQLPFLVLQSKSPNVLNI